MHFTKYAKDEFAIYTGQTKFQMMICMLKLNATVWQQKYIHGEKGVAALSLMDREELD